MLISLHSIEYLGSKKVLLIGKCCFYVLACKANFLKFSKYKCWIFSSKDINSKILYVLVYRSLLKRLYNYNVRVGNIYLIDILLNMAFVMYISGRVRLTLSSDEGWNTIFHFPIITSRISCLQHDFSYNENVGLLSAFACGGCSSILKVIYLVDRWFRIACSLAFIWPVLQSHIKSVLSSFVYMYWNLEQDWTLLF